MPRSSYPQAAAVPWRPGDDEPEVLLISTRRPADPSRPNWVLPQGGVEPGQTPAQAAAAEAWEEAGVEGAVEPVPFTFYDYEMGSGLCHVSVYRMKVEHEAGRWPESADRIRRWLPWREATSIISGEALRIVLERFHPADPKGSPG